jgi:hypothetical protein
MSFARFQAGMPTGNSDRLLLPTLRKAHGAELHTAAEWQDLIDKMKSKPISYENLRRPAGR